LNAHDQMTVEFQSRKTTKRRLIDGGAELTTVYGDQPWPSACIAGEISVKPAFSRGAFPRTQSGGVWQNEFDFRGWPAPSVERFGQKRLCFALSLIFSDAHCAGK
jgi:hypothetical protein